MLTDAQLIQASIDGDDAAFKMIVKKYESRIAATIIGMLGPGQDAEDAGQQTFIRFYESMRQFKGKSSVSTYLTRIAINLSLNILKRRKRQRERFLHPVFGEKEIVASNANEYDDQKEIIHQAIQQLSPEFRSVIVLRFLKEHSIKEISEILGIPQGTVLSRLARGQKKLRTLLDPLLGENDVRQDVQSVAQII
ncbi:sigma-70 family RNA polymerase sigma factor [bacterium]|nr:sigma-70 family RNA polymerase sigma factor [bacterium]